MNAAIQSSKLLWRVQARHVSKAQCITEEMWMFSEDRKTVIDIIYNKYAIFHFSLALKYLIGKIDSEMSIILFKKTPFSNKAYIEKSWKVMSFKRDYTTVQAALALNHVKISAGWHHVAVICRLQSRGEFIFRSDFNSHI